jgi:hypothetical protein
MKHLLDKHKTRKDPKSENQRTNQLLDKKRIDHYRRTILEEGMNGITGNQRGA